MSPARRRAPAPEIRYALVLQGGGALGAYELGVLQRLFKEPGFQPHYVSGVSIGAITAAILVGARNGDPLACLASLWEDFVVKGSPVVPAFFEPGLSALGNPAFYRVRRDYLAMPFWTSFYELGPIRDRLCELVDFDALMESPTRLVVTATNIETGEIEAFDNSGATGPLTVDHVLASGSLPPGFPMTPIGESLYWDGGLFDNTPLSPLLKLIDPIDAPHTKLFVVNLFPKAGKVPKDMIAVSDRMIELIFANKMRKDVDIAKTVNRFVALIDEMVAAHPEVRHLLDQPEFEQLRRYKALSDIVEITNNRDEPVNAASDFSRDAIAARIAAGLHDADKALKETMAAAA
ncbi:MAG: patatin-like phospholipase family protein [Bauldia sp.]|nr:patatin-like phospholipase family protein [Bauldia sp.]